ncbi:MAG TPA: RHS repeat-associated core domain-containing protein, partial [Candidatus Dormibacteraeota bacterium]|nr:RHS repeat-associated core domain-containing protein [Candidatus Dormibacteraeota bacterium]
TKTSANYGIGRLTSETFSGGPNNSLSGSYCYAYDARGEETNRTLTIAGDCRSSSGYSVGTNYDDAGNILTQTYPTGEVVTNSYNSADWLTGVSTSQGTTTLLSNATYSSSQGSEYGGPAGLMTSANLDNGAFVATWSHDALLRASGSYLSCISRCGSPAFSDSRTFDAAGNVTSARTQFGGILTADVQGFCYDEQDRLIWAGTSGSPPSGCTQPVTPGSFGTAGYQAAYSYDPLGRLTSGPLGSYSYADPKHLHAATSIGSAWTGSYDAAGNLTCRAASSVSTCAGTQTGAQLTYNPQGSLAIWQNASSSPTTVANFLYDGQGNRVEQQLSQNGTTTTTIYVGNLEELVSSGSGMTTQTYYYANDHRIAMAVNGAFSYLASSGLGSVEVAIPASNLSAQVNQLYEPYGNLRYSNGAMPTDYGFTGQHSDSASGLDYYNARYYDPVAGQFASADSMLPGNGFDIWGLSRYAYVEGNPESRVDPSGNVIQCADSCGGEEPVTTGTGTTDAPGYVPPTPDAGRTSLGNPTTQSSTCNLISCVGEGANWVLFHLLDAFAQPVYAPSSKGKENGLEQTARLPKLSTPGGSTIFSRAR